MAWINTGRNGWFEEWFTRYSKTIEIFDEDRTGAHWHDTALGDEIVLVSDGGWRMTLDAEPYRSRYRVFRFIADLDQVIEQPKLLQGVARGGGFDPDESAAGRYSQVRLEAIAAIDAALGARESAAVTAH